MQTLDLCWEKKAFFGRAAAGEGTLGQAGASPHAYTRPQHTYGSGKALLKFGEYISCPWRRVNSDVISGDIL